VAPGAEGLDGVELFALTPSIDADALRPRLALAPALGPRLAVVLRGPGPGARATLALAREAEAALRPYGAWLFVSRRVDVFSALRAAAPGARLGLALPEAAMAPSDARRLVGAGVVILASRHSLADARRAAEDGASAILASPFAPTPAKPGATPLGVDGLAAWVRALAPTPVVALGGIDAANVAAAWGAGAAAIAAIRGAIDGGARGARALLGDDSRGARPGSSTAADTSPRKI
jgi:thiamine-phosphate pyrophosphorylase